MTLPLTVRLDPKTSQRLIRIARRERLSLSEMARQAIVAWIDRHEPITSPYEVVADLIGIVRSGKARGSSKTGRRFEKLLKGRRRSRDTSH
jgi:hypothetical protein